MSQADRVDVYTRQSLYALLWGMEAVLLVTTAVDDDPIVQGADLAVVLVAGLLTTAASARVLRRAMSDYPDTWRVPWDVAWPLPVLALGAAAALAPTGQEVRLVGSVVVTMPIACALGAVRSRRETIGLVVALTAYAVLLSWTWRGGLVALGIALFFVFTVRVSLWVLVVVRELDRARDAAARLAVAEERLRFSRDVHDVMGRQLSTIAVQSELAATLAKRGDSQPAAEQMMTVRSAAQEALREARELARGYRSTELSSELAGARSLLRSAGIDAQLAVDEIPAAWHEAAGWVIREAVTNVLRHSTASIVRLSWNDGVLVIENDGVPAGADAGDGAGLLGLRERLAPLGADLEVDHGGTRFALRAHFPGEAPA